MFLYICHGMGGSNDLEPASPLNFPSLIAYINCSSFQLPVPVASEVKLAAKEIPQGPIHEVKSLVVTNPLLSNSFRFTSGGDSCAGWPDNNKALSISGPRSVIFFGE